MAPFSSYFFYVFLLQNVASTVAVEQCEQREDDSPTYLQKRVQTHVQSKKRTCENDGLVNTGICVGEDCQCLPEDAVLNVPTDAERFPLGSLSCSGNGNACKRPSDQVGEPLRFKEAGDYLTCEGGGEVCGGLVVENVGAACFRAESSGIIGGGSSVTLGSSTCVHDVCCHTDGQGSGSVCSGQSTFAGVNSLSCNGLNACDELTADIKGDVYCLGNSCHSAQLTFDASTHCIVTSPTALDDLVDATLTFNGGANSKNTLECPGKCAAQINLQAGACLHVNCPAVSECPTVTLGAGATCYCTGLGCPANCQSTTPCHTEPACDASPSACCAQDSSNNPPVPDCGVCCPGQVSTTDVEGLIATIFGEITINLEGATVEQMEQAIREALSEALGVPIEQIQVKLSPALLLVRLTRQLFTFSYVITVPASEAPDVVEQLDEVGSDPESFNEVLAPALVEQGVPESDAENLETVAFSNATVEVDTSTTSTTSTSTSTSLGELGETTEKPKPTKPPQPYPYNNRRNRRQNRRDRRQNRRDRREYH